MVQHSPATDAASLLSAARNLAPLVRELAPQGEQERRLPQPLVEAFTETGIFRMCRPRALGGLETDPLTVIQVVEELSRADGSAGWCAMISGAGSVFDAFIPAVGGALMYANPRAVTGGALAPTGRAIEVDGGYRVSGRWSMVSGCQYSDWLGGSSVVFDGDAPRMGPGGMPETIVPMFSSKELSIIDTWNVSGLRGSGSHDFEVDRVFVPESRVIRIPMMVPEHEGALYSFPFFGFLSASIASTALGIARAAIDELVGLAKQKTPFGMMSSLATRPQTAQAVAEAEACLQSARSFLLDVTGEIWERTKSGAGATVAERATLRMAATHATLSSVRAVDLMYTAGGATSLYAKSPLQRCFRDVHAVTQHFTVAPHTQELQGRILLGLEADVMML
jgi:indole-3-acetate monooxygenase